MVKTLAPALLVILLAPAVARAADEAMPTDWSKIAEEICVAGGREIRVSVSESADTKAGTVGWLNEACLFGEGLPTTCLSVMSQAEPLPQGLASGGRSFLIRCVPGTGSAWSIGTRWTSNGIEVEATRLDLRALTGAQVLDHGDQPREVVMAPGLPLTPDAAVTWKAHDPQPKTECIPLSIEATAADAGWDMTITPASLECPGWRLHHEAATGMTKAEALAGYAPPDITAGIAKGPITVSRAKKPGEAAKPAAETTPAQAKPAETKPAKEPKPAKAKAPRPEGEHAAFMSFSRR